MNIKFNSQNNEKVINIETNYGEIRLSENPLSDKNYHPQDKNQSSSNQNLIILAIVSIVAIVGIVIFILLIQPRETAIQNPSVNSITSVKIDTLQNKSIIEGNSDESSIELKANSPKRVLNIPKSKENFTQNKNIKKKDSIILPETTKLDNKPIPSDCSGKPNGCS